MTRLHITKTFISADLPAGALQVAEALQAKIGGRFPGAVPLHADKLHITVCSFGSLKPHRATLKEWVGREADLPQPPEGVLTPAAYLQIVGDRWSWASTLEAQAAWHFWRSELLSSLGFPPLPLLDAGRVFHLSLANKDGSPFSSVGPAFEPLTGSGLRIAL
jgi:hypothetical protein